MCFAIILIKGQKVDFLCLKKRVWFYWECLLISCAFQLHDPRSVINRFFVCVCSYAVITELN